jgi:hypothetical protein
MSRKARGDFTVLGSFLFFSSMIEADKREAQDGIEEEV